MRGLYILSEGQTEEQFINEVLSHYFIARGIYDIRPILMETSSGHKGGALSFQRYKNNAMNLLKRENDIIVTSLIDYFRLETNFPQFDNALKIGNKFERVTALEQAIRNNIDHPRMVPYIQLHEFEGLLFSSNLGFDYIPDIPEENRVLLNNAVYEHENPELLNDGAETAPSKRLGKLIPGYEKTFHGPIIGDVITVEIIMGRCVRFRNWIDNLVERMQA